MGVASHGHRRRLREGLPPARYASPPRGRPPQPGPSDSFARAVCPFTGMLVGVARRILGDEVQAWDAVQEALIGLWHEGAIPPNPRAWLTRAVVLRSLHQARSRSRRRRHESLACGLHHEASDRDEPSKRLEYQELSADLDDAFRSLPAEYRDVILLRSAAHMDYAAIAEVLKLPVGTVRSRLNRARRVFQETLDRASESPDPTSPMTVSTREPHNDIPRLPRKKSCPGPASSVPHAASP